MKQKLVVNLFGFLIRLIRSLAEEQFVCHILLDEEVFVGVNEHRCDV
jgi:hypothetical protein